MKRTKRTKKKRERKEKRKRGPGGGTAQTFDSKIGGTQALSGEYAGAGAELFDESLRSWMLCRKEGEDAQLVDKKMLINQPNPPASQSNSFFNRLSMLFKAGSKDDVRRRFLDCILN